MVKQKSISKSYLITIYMDYVSTYQEAPKSVHDFANDHDFDESKFYAHFKSFKDIESTIFKEFHNNTIKILKKSSNYAAYNTRNQLLSYYFTFFENLTANRSYVLYALKGCYTSLNHLKTLSPLRKAFKDYIKTLDIETLQLKEDKLMKLQEGILTESAWIQLMITLKFWLDDTSNSFEKTDIFIEKSLNASFDLINIQPIDSLIDLAKFWFKEKIKTN